MQSKYICIGMSLFIHSLLFFKVNHRFDQEIDIKEDQKIKVKIKISKPKQKVLKKVFKTKKSKLSFSMLGVSSLEKLDDNALMANTVKDGDIQKNIEMFNHLSQYLIYPKEFVKHEIKGNVIAFVCFDKNGTFLIDKLKLNSSSPYLRAYIAMTLERAFKKYKMKGLKKYARYKMLFEFKMTTKGKDFEKILDDGFYYSRWKYGVTTGGDELVHGINKGLMHITNWLTLLEYIPEGKEQKQKRIRSLEKYERSRFF